MVCTTTRLFEGERGWIVEIKVYQADQSQSLQVFTINESLPDNSFTTDESLPIDVFTLNKSLPTILFNRNNRGMNEEQLGS